MPRPLSTETTDPIFRVFPMLLDDDWEDSVLHCGTFISIWDHWLTRNEYDQILADPKAKDEEEWHSRFESLHRMILDKSKVFWCNYTDDHWKVFNANNCDYLLERLRKYNMILLIPEMKIIYAAGYDFTSAVYCQDQHYFEIFQKWVISSSLKLIKEVE